MIPTLDLCAPYIAPETIQAVIQVESSGNPLAINVNGVGTFSPTDLNQAIAIAKYFIAQGRKVDLGLMQVDSENLASSGQTVRTIFDPCANIAAGGRILENDYRTALRAGQIGASALDAALSAYNTGSLTAGFYNGYVQKYHAGRITYSNASANIPSGNMTLYSRVVSNATPSAEDGMTLYIKEK